VIVSQNNLSSLLQLTKSFAEFQFSNTPYMLIVIIFGALYYILNIRDLLWNPYHERIKNNIKDTLIGPFKDFNQKQISFLKEGRRLMYVFYYFVDNDNSLIQKAKRVRFNGLMWTSTIDLTIMATIGSFMFWFKVILERSSYDLIMAVGLLLVALISFGLIEVATRRHISLSNEQLEIICELHKEELQKRINELLQNKSSS
jgi:hypothetical protein